MGKAASWLAEAANAAASSDQSPERSPDASSSMQAPDNQPAQVAFSMNVSTKKVHVRCTTL